ncbi:MAG: acyl-CoA dehydrogenase family protein [Firmicutes bacterium]|nr:acyl-CoA dehydrogenase family protein [Bacillota bacterium]
MPLDPLDLLESEYGLREDERQIREAVRRFVDQEVLPLVREAWEEGRFPRQLVPRMGQLGLLGADLPEEYGGAGMEAVGYGLIMQELERADSGIRSFASVQGGLVMHAIHDFGSEEQRRRWLPALARGEAVGCFGLTEPGAGSDPAAMQTRARRDGDGWRLTGSKMWITNAPIADVAVIWSREERETGRGRVLGFLVERGTPNFRVETVHHKASMRCSETGAIWLEDVRVGEEARLPGAESLRAPLSCLDQARYGIAWGTVGAASACLREALDWARTRESFGAPIAARQMVQERLVAMASTLAAMRLSALQIGRLKEAGRLDPLQVSLVKRNNARGALEIARQARGLLGASGITLEYASIRHMLNLETVETYEGTYEVHTLAIGREITGFNAFAG